MTEAHNKDLPLTANTDDIRATHYMFHLTCDLENRIFCGYTIIFLEPVGESCDQVTGDSSPPRQIYCKDERTGNNNSPFICTLDCCDINIKCVEEIICSDERINTFLNFNNNLRNRYDEMSKWQDHSRQPLKYSVDDWSVHIWKENIYNQFSFPRVICITYNTLSTGSSITWATDQDGRKCAFTQGAWINNRSLFPCQEPPIAMATWQAGITVPNDVCVLMSGDLNEEVFVQTNGQKIFYYFTDMILPLSTLALAIGYWKCQTVISPAEALKLKTDINKNLADECSHDDYPCYLQKGMHSPIIPCRLFAPSALIMKAFQEFRKYLPRCLEAAFNLLGPHPFKKLDILIVPRCFGSLGLASPNILIISQSLLADDGSMCIRLAHEISHSWFGLLIGARDWTEEWLSEGFATYMEDYIHGLAMQVYERDVVGDIPGEIGTQFCLRNKIEKIEARNPGLMFLRDVNKMLQGESEKQLNAYSWDDDKQKHHAEIRALLRYFSLKAELKNTSSDLQTLRPNFGKEIREGTVAYVQNGMNPEKWFTQVHYLKGYFLLRHLSCQVGERRFNNFLKCYILKYHGQLVHSKEIFKLFFESFPVIRDITMESIYENWLDYPGMPKDLINYKASVGNILYDDVITQVNDWKQINRGHFKRKKSKCDIQFPKGIQLEADQLVLFLELMLRIRKLHSSTLLQMEDNFQLHKCNADIKHRWCELIIKHNCRRNLPVLRSFLIENQAMGVYLYGELVLCNRKEYRKLAEECFNEVKDEMDTSSYQVVKEMLFSND